MEPITTVTKNPKRVEAGKKGAEARRLKRMETIPENADSNFSNANSNADSNFSNANSNANTNFSNLSNAEGVNG